MPYVEKKIKIIIDNNQLEVPIYVYEYSENDPPKDKKPYHFILCENPQQQCNIDNLIIQLLLNVITQSYHIEDNYIKITINNKTFYLKKIKHNNNVYLIKSNNNELKIQDDDMYLDDKYEFIPIKDEFKNSKFLNVIELKYQIKYLKYKQKYFKLKNIVLIYKKYLQKTI